MNHDNFTEVTSEDAPKVTNLLPAELAWASGYNTCLERTNAAELLQCLIQVHDNLDQHGYVKNETYLLVSNAIKKATDEK